MRPITIDHPAGDEAFGRLSSAANLPTAVACINDQVTVVSFGGGIFAQIVSPALTSVNQNYSELAQQTVEVLLAGIAGEKTPAPSVSPPFWSNGNRAGHSAQALRRGAALELERLTTGPKGGESALDRGHLLFVTTEMPPMPLDILIHLHPARFWQVVAGEVDPRSIGSRWPEVQATCCTTAFQLRSAVLRKDRRS